LLLLVSAAPRTESERAAAVAKRDLAAAQAQAAALADQRTKAAATMRGIEQAVLAATEKLQEAARAQGVADTALAQREADFSALVPLMLRLSRYPAETILAVPASPEQAMAGLMITRGLAAEINRQAAALRAQQSEAARLRQETARQEAALSAERTRQAQNAAALDALIAQANAQVTAAEAAGRAAAEAVAAEAARAETLRGAIATMDSAQPKAAARAAREAETAERTQDPGAEDAARAREAALTRPALSQSLGTLTTPVAGRILHGFGTPAIDGPATGITYAVAAGAFVSAPCLGRVAFAAPFRSYGELVILECGGGYDMVLAGLGRIDSAPGRAVRPGEPIGRMPQSPAAPTLYVELRAHGQPVDPAPFLKDKG
jgi:septal ring factor EnvC (AmiA/AmiB activator)